MCKNINTQQKSNKFFKKMRLQLLQSLWFKLNRLSWTFKGWTYLFDSIREKTSCCPLKCGKHMAHQQHDRNHIYYLVCHCDNYNFIVKMQLYELHCKRILSMLGSQWELVWYQIPCNVKARIAYQSLKLERFL